MNRKSQKPSALCRSQLNRFQPTPRLTARLRFHRLDAGPPDNDAGHEENGGDKAEDAVPETPFAIEEQLVVKARQPQHEILALRHRVAELFAGVRVEEPLLLDAVLLEPDLECRVATGDSVAEPRNLPAGIRLLADRTQLVLGEHFRSCLVWRARRREVAIELVAIDQRAAGDAEHDDVEADGQADPQVNLKRRPPQPDPLRLPQPPLPEFHVSPAPAPCRAARDLYTTFRSFAPLAPIRPEAPSK